MRHGAEDGDWGASIGEAIGGFIGWMLQLVADLWRALADGLQGFTDGLARGIGLADAGVLSWIVVAIGIFLLYQAVRGFMRRRILGPLVMLVIGAFLISGVMA